MAEITYEPLLCYLLVLSGYATDDVAIVSGNLNVIYQKLVEEVWRRGWGDGVAGQRHPGAGRFLDLDGFNSLMETIALAGWKGGDTRICTEQSFQLAAKALKTEEAWDKFVKDSGADITNLAINFYLKRSDTDARGFEFTHKSFGDYLAARALIRVAFEVGRLAEMREEAGLKGWFDIASDGRLSHEVLDFMTREFKLLVGADCREKVLSLKRTFEKLASSILRDGLPANGNASEAWRVAEKKQRDAEIMIWAILAGCSTALADSKSLTHTLNEDTLINVVWPDPTSLGDLLRRMTRQADLNAFSESALPANHRRSWSAIFKAAATVLSEYNINVPSLLPVVAAQFLWTDKIGTGKARPNKAATTFALRYRAVEADLRRSRVAADIAPVMRCFAFLNARCADLSCQIICGIDLRNADLREARFDNATILYGDLRGANLQRATFRNATLDNTLFGEADLTESMWPQAKISQTELSDAVLTGASLEGAIMLEGDIRTDDLKDKGALVAGIRTVQSQVRAEPSELPSTEKAASDEASAS